MRVSWDAEIGRTEGQMLLTSVALQRLCRELGRGLPAPHVHRGIWYGRYQRTRTSSRGAPAHLCLLIFCYNTRVRVGRRAMFLKKAMLEALQQEF